MTYACNVCPSRLAIFLTGTGIPQYILDLPREALSTPMGGLIQQMLAPRQGVGSPFPFPLGVTPQAYVNTQPASSSSPAASASASASAPASEASSSSLAASASEATRATKHLHDSLELPVLKSFDTPFLLNQMGDKGAASIERLRALQASHHEDRGTVSPTEEVEALSDLIKYLQQPPLESSPPPPRGCYRLIARVLAEWPVASWGPMLDLLRLLILYAPINKHYAKSAGNPLRTMVRRCIQQSDAPRPIQIRALFVAVNAFAHEPGSTILSYVEHKSHFQAPHTFSRPRAL